MRARVRVSVSAIGSVRVIKSAIESARVSVIESTRVSKFGGSVHVVDQEVVVDNRVTQCNTT